MRTRPPVGTKGAASRVTRKTAVRFVAMIAFQRESSESSSGVGPPRPAPLTRMSMRPHFAAAAVMALETEKAWELALLELQGQEHQESVSNL